MEKILFYGIQKFLVCINSLRAGHLLLPMAIAPHGTTLALREMHGVQEHLATTSFMLQKIIN
jgi:hypothetical protein